jgi:hypothetical protein
MLLPWQSRVTSGDGPHAEIGWGAAWDETAKWRRSMMGSREEAKANKRWKR